MQLMLRQEAPTATTTTVPPVPPSPPEIRPAIARVLSKGTRGRVKIRRRKVGGEIQSTAGRTIEVDVAYVNARTPNHWRLTRSTILQPLILRQPRLKE